MDICRIDFCSIDPTEPTLNNIKKHKNCLGGKNPKNFVTIQSQTVFLHAIKILFFIYRIAITKGSASDKSAVGEKMYYNFKYTNECYHTHKLFFLGFFLLPLVAY